MMLPFVRLSVGPRVAGLCEELFLRTCCCRGRLAGLRLEGGGRARAHRVTGAVGVRLERHLCFKSTRHLVGSVALPAGRRLAALNILLQLRPLPDATTRLVRDPSGARQTGCELRLCRFATWAGTSPRLLPEGGRWRYLELSAV